MVGAREEPEPLNKLLNSHPAGFYFYLNGVAQIRTVILAESLALNLFVPFVNFSRRRLGNLADAALVMTSRRAHSKRPNADFVIRESHTVLPHSPRRGHN